MPGLVKSHDGPSEHKSSWSQMSCFKASETAARRRLTTTQNSQRSKASNTVMETWKSVNCPRGGFLCALNTQFSDGYYNRLHFTAVLKFKNDFQPQNTKSKEITFTKLVAIFIRSCSCRFKLKVIYSDTFFMPNAVTSWCLTNSMEQSSLAVF